MGAAGNYQWGSEVWEKINTPYYFVRVAYTPVSAPVNIMMHAENESGKPVMQVRDDHHYWIRSAEELVTSSFDTSGLVRTNVTSTNSDTRHQDALAAIYAQLSSPDVVTEMGPNSETSVHSIGNDVIRTFFFKLHSGSRRLKLSFAVAKSEFVDYIINPSAFPTHTDN